MRKRSKLYLVLALFLIMSFSSIQAFISEPHGVFSDKPLADINYGWRGIYFQPKMASISLVLTVSRPDGSNFQRKFKAGEAPFYELLSTDSDGSYTYELRVILEGGERNRKGLDRAENSASETGFLQKGSSYSKKKTQTGYFQVLGQRILTSGTAAEERVSSQDTVSIQDQVISDDLIVDGSLSVGDNSYSGYAFGFDTIALRENNLRIFFDDTSTIGNYPRNDWRFIANDSTDGGGRYFSIEDATNVSKILTLEAGAPDSSLYVDSYGDVGINTSTPYYELHIVDGDSPCVRLEQDGSYGWTPQKWDLCGNESNFFIRDATHASKLPFRIEPDAPTDSIFVKSNGYVGIGTSSPAFPFELETTGENAILLVDRTDGATTGFSASGDKAAWGTLTNHPLYLIINNSFKAVFQTNGSFHMMSGARCSAAGQWIDASSRELKENIQALSIEEAAETLEALKPVRFNYKVDSEEESLGFIAEDVPDLVATKDRKGMSAMDVVAVLTKVVQEQKRIVEKQQLTIEALKKRVAELEK